MADILSWIVPPGLDLFQSLPAVETKGRDFDEVHAQARRAWNKMLGRIRVKDRKSVV